MEAALWYKRSYVLPLPRGVTYFKINMCYFFDRTNMYRYFATCQQWKHYRMVITLARAQWVEFAIISKSKCSHLARASQILLPFAWRSFNFIYSNDLFPLKHEFYSCPRATYAAARRFLYICRNIILRLFIKLLRDTFLEHNHLSRLMLSKQQ